MFFVLLLCSCTSTRIVEVPVKTIEKEYIHNTKVDSIYIRDSVDRWISGDTFYIYKERTKYVTKEIVDTVCKTDTITEVVTIENIKEVKVNYLKWYQEALMWMGGVLTFVLLLYILIKIKIK